MRYIIAFALLFSFCFSGAGYAQRKEMKKAQHAFDDGDYYHCVDYYTQAQELKGVLGLDDKKRLARSYFELNKVMQAYDIYSEMESNITDEDIFIYAKVNHRMGIYDAAIEWYDKAKKSGTLTESILHVNDMIEACRWASANEQMLFEYRVNPNFTLASQGQSFGVQIYNDKVVYSSAPKESKNVDRNGNPFLNLYTSDFIDGKVIENSSQVFSNNLISPYHVGAISFTSDKKHMFYTKSVYVNKIPMLKLYVVDFNGTDWVNERLVNFDSDDFDLAHPAVSLDDEYLYFVSNMPDHTKIFGKDVKNYGGKDIYRAKFGKTVGEFTKVENLGREINTYGDEVYPVINPDGKLYFSSDVRKGYGGLDLFCAEYIDGKWQNARNMLKPFNSNVDDFCYVQTPNNPDRGFLSSNRYNTMDADVIHDVYKVDDSEAQQVEAPPVFGEEDLVMTGEELTANAVEEVIPEDVQQAPVEEAPVKATISTSVRSTYNNEVIPGASIVLKDEDTEAAIVTVSTGDDGRATLSYDALPDDKEVVIVVSKPGYNEKTVQATASELVALVKDGFKLTPIFNDEVLDDISGMSIAYDDDFDDEAKATLDKLANYLLSKPNVVVKLNAHTEAKGNRYGNLEVSQTMAEKAKEYLMAKGVSDNQLIPRGYGERYLKNKCHRGVYCTAAQHKDNRRIEVVVWNIEK